MSDKKYKNFKPDHVAASPAEAKAWLRERIGELPTDKYHEVWSALNNVINAWEALEGGRNHRPAVIAEWLAQHMSPAINRARKAAGRKAPGGNE